MHDRDGRAEGVAETPQRRDVVGVVGAGLQRALPAGKLHEAGEPAGRLWLAFEDGPDLGTRLGSRVVSLGRAIPQGRRIARRPPAREGARGVEEHPLMCWVVVVALEQPAVVGGRADHRQLADGPGERQHAVVGQEDDGLGGGGPGQRHVGWILEHRRDPAGVDIRRLEQPQAQLADEHPADGGIHRGHGHPPSGKRRLQRLAEAVEGGQLQVQTGGDRLDRGSGTVGGHPVVAGEQRHGEVVGHHHPVEAQLPAQQVGEQLRGPTARQSVDAAVRAHDRGQARLPDGRCERLRVHLAQLSRPDLHRGVVAPSLREPVGKEVLARGQDPAGQVAGLHAPHVGRSQGAHQDGVLPVALLQPSPSRVSGDVQHRGQAVARPDGEQLAAHGPRDRFDQGWVPTAGEAEGLGKDGRPPGAVAGQGLLMDDQRDAQAGALHDRPLYLVDQLRALLRLQAGRGADACHLADPVGDHAEGGLPVEALARDQVGKAHGAQLSQLLVDAHAPEEVVRPVVHGSGRVGVRRSGHWRVLTSKRGWRGAASVCAGVIAEQSHRSP